MRELRVHGRAVQYRRGGGSATGSTDTVGALGRRRLAVVLAGVNDPLVEVVEPLAGDAVVILAHQGRTPRGALVLSASDVRDRLRLGRRYRRYLVVPVRDDGLSRVCEREAQPDGVDPAAERLELRSDDLHAVGRLRVERVETVESDVVLDLLQPFLVLIGARNILVRPEEHLVDVLGEQRGVATPLSQVLRPHTFTGRRLEGRRNSVGELTEVVVSGLDGPDRVVHVVVVDAERLRGDVIRLGVECDGSHRAIVVLTDDREVRRHRQSNDNEDGANDGNHTPESFSHFDLLGVNRFLIYCAPGNGGAGLCYSRAWRL
ncbi:MAG: hypothetical protein JWM52_259 [Candidatus Saccharibacteria bacterium]|nr:hypothetical protein [Candidatus Saccharibacteria bacterium]